MKIIKTQPIQFKADRCQFKVRAIVMNKIKFHLKVIILTNYIKTQQIQK